MEDNTDTGYKTAEKPDTCGRKGCFKPAIEGGYCPPCTLSLEDMEAEMHATMCDDDYHMRGEY